MAESHLVFCDTFCFFVQYLRDPIDRQFTNRVLQDGGQCSDSAIYIYWFHLLE